MPHHMFDRGLGRRSVEIKAAAMQACDDGDWLLGHVKAQATRRGAALMVMPDYTHMHT